GTKPSLDLDPGAGAGAPLDHAHDPPARGGHPGHGLPADPAGHQLRRPQVRDEPSRLPDRFLHHLLARVRLHPGGRLPPDRPRAEPRGGQPERLLQPPSAHPDPPGGAGDRPAGGHAHPRPLPGRDLHLGRPARRGQHSGGLRGSAGDDRAGDLHLPRVRERRPRHRHAGGRAGEGPEPLPADLRLPLPQLHEPAEEPDPDGLVPDRRHLQPGQLHGRGPPQPVDHRLGRRGACTRLRLRAGHPRLRAVLRLHRPPREDGPHVNRYLSVAGGLAWRLLHSLFTNPLLFLPPMLMPLFFFTAFAGGLSAVSNVPGFDYAPGYTSFIFAFVLCQSAAFGGVFSGFSIAADFQFGFGRRLLLATPHRSALILGYALVAVIRATITITVVTLVALLVGLNIGGNGLDVFGMYALAAIINVTGLLFAAGVALRFRSLQATPLMQVPVFLFLFLAPVYVPRHLLGGWVHAVAPFNPATHVMETVRELIA